MLLTPPETGIEWQPAHESPLKVGPIPSATSSMSSNTARSRSWMYCDTQPFVTLSKPLGASVSPTVWLSTVRGDRNGAARANIASVQARVFKDRITLLHDERWPKNYSSSL